MGDYQTTINSILQSQRQLMSGVNNVYPGFSLNNLVSDAQRQERANIAGITNAAQDVDIQKHLNLAQLYGEKYDVLSTNIKLIADNKDMFLTNFNENTEKIDQLNNAISTKNKIIQINYYEQTKKDRIIFIMTRIILYLFLMIFPVILIAMNYLSVVYGIIFIIVCAIITVVVVFFQLKNNQDIDAINVMNKTKETAKDFARTVVRNVFPSSFIKSCPSKENPSRTVSFNYESGNEVSLDNSQNMWVEGDIPTIGATKQGYLALGEEAEPMPYYGGDKFTPEYTCEWSGDPSKRTNMNHKDIRFKTTIPCEYYPGYKTIT